ncbi:hypothetical protein DLAC_09566 [Tieghemostelium lacteum]|uniref:Uncharacterized protein n=1 Tax=Tieghemostelium lacteum TaxID=361077 RepID=A0A151Z6M4_TIELA|nr:hypothetical protein DLAC_09566 [Tieghemostelium lacteum]|eukprot:KYQ89610.1 hypothetical protein DLAC_09566 [Tieghemostelium lacteum]
MYLEAVKHMEEFPIQRQEYKTQKDRILGNVDGDECMIVLDFSQLQIQQSFRQDLIICIFRNYGTVDGLSQILKTYHYVSPPGTHADVTFVIGSIQINNNILYSLKSKSNDTFHCLIEIISSQFSSLYLTHNQNNSTRSS